MAIKTAAEYKESLRQQQPTTYLDGERVDSIADNDRFRYGIRSVAVTYDGSYDPQLKDLAVVDSDLVGEPISRWTKLQTSMEDALAKTRLWRSMGDTLCSCNYRCLTSDSLNAAWVTSHDIDKKYGTHYRERVQAKLEQAQREDWTIGACIVDPRGDRRYRPLEQPDQDMFLHVVERRPDGVVVRGAKAHATASAYTNQLCVFPSRPMQPDEKDFAIAFFTPVDAPGITFIAKDPPGPEEPFAYEFPYSSQFGQLECFTIFDDVFVPNENIFIDGEVEFTGPMLGVFNSFHVWQKCACRSMSMDLDIGALALVTEYNGTDAAPHIKDYLMEMAMSVEIVYACALAAAANGTKHESGVYIPYRPAANSGKVFAARKLGEDRYFMQEAAGGLVTTMSGDKDLLSPETGPKLMKYLKAREDVPVEKRIRAMRLIEDLTASRWAGWYHGMCISGGATPQLLKERVLADYDLAKVKERAKKAARIEE